MPQEFAPGVEAQVKELAEQNGITLEAKEREHFERRFQMLVEERGGDEAQHQIDLEMEALKRKRTN